MASQPTSQLEVYKVIYDNLNDLLSTFSPDEDISPLLEFRDNIRKMVSQAKTIKDLFGDLIRVTNGVLPNPDAALRKLESMIEKLDVLFTHQLQLAGEIQQIQIHKLPSSSAIVEIDSVANELFSELKHKVQHVGGIPSEFIKSLLEEAIIYAEQLISMFQ